jgi:hypothetical protein
LKSKTFILGLGAAKSGTTWIYDYIKRFNVVDSGFRKEYFIWDAITLPAFAHFRVPYGQPIINTNHLLRREMQTYSDAYFSYFASLLTQDTTSITADLTASYTSLSAETLIKIREGFNKRGIRCKVVFMIRDPVERCHSMIRMFQQKGFPKGHLGLDLEQDEDQLLLQYYNTEHCRSLTSYERTLANIQIAGFRTEDTFIGIYENFFKEDELLRFTQFLQLPLDLKLLDQKSNTTRRPVVLSHKTRAQVAAAYALTYRECHARFPIVSSLWSSFALLDKKQERGVVADCWTSS